jgi:hypothetical protein
MNTDQNSFNIESLTSKAPSGPQTKVTDWQAVLEGLNQKRGIIRTRIQGVWDRVYPGVYLFGPPGTGKTHTVIETLKRLKHEEPTTKEYVYHRGHLTPMGLFEMIDEHHDKTLVLDDVHLLFEQPLSLQLLMAALGSSVDGTRYVKYRRQGFEQTTAFTGGIICISNLDLVRGRNDAVLQALASRAHVIRYAPSTSEMEALVRELATLGWERHAGENAFFLHSGECNVVANFLIEECRVRGRQLDLRLFLDKAIPDYCHCRTGETEIDWRDLIRSTLDEELVEPSYSDLPQFEMTRQARKEREVALVAEILAEHTEPELRLA